MDQSFGIKPFCFDTEFAASAPRADGRLGEGALEASALRAEMEAMRAEHGAAVERVRNEAYLEGLAQARAERQQAVLAALDALQAEWEAFADGREAMIGHLRTEACALARTIGEALAARALSDTPVDAIDEAIGRVLGQIARGQEVLILVNPDLVEQVEERIGGHQSQDRRRLNLVVQPDEAIPPGDAHMRWEGGGLRLDAQARAAAVFAELEALGAAEFMRP